MRVSDRMAYDQLNTNISRNRNEMAQLQNQAATQKRVTKPSDDPVAASRVLFSRTEQRGIDQYIKNLNYARSFLDFTEQSLAELSEVIVRAKELALSQANDASSNAQSKKIVAAEIAQLHDQSVQIGNRKLGERYIFGGYKTTQPPFGQNGEYRGDSGEIRIHIDKDSFLPMNLPGNVVFHGEGLSRDGVAYRSMKQPRTLEELIDQKLGLEETGAAMLRGPASLRTPNVGGAETAGDGGINIFNTLKRLESSLVADDKEGVQESLDRLDDALQQVVLARTQLGARVMAIDNSLNSMHTATVDNKATMSQLEDADAFEVISNINKTESALQATLQTSGKLVQKSLLDFLG